MQQNRPIALSIAGLDPSGGAGLFADIKTFEQHKVYGLGISTAQTIQNEDHFYSIKWEKEKDILEALNRMLTHYNIKTIKIGIIESLSVLNKVVSLIHQSDKAIKIVIDPVLKSSTDFNFIEKEVDQELLFNTLGKVFLITPNYKEVVQLSSSDSPKDAAKKLSMYCNVLLKGGHNPDEQGVDYLCTKAEIKKLLPDKKNTSSKHGSGCVLSASIASNLAYGYDLENSCRNAKKYIELFLSSTNSLLGYHYV